MFPEMKSIGQKLLNFLNTPVFLFRHEKHFSADSCIIFFPVQYSRLNCGLSGILSFKRLSKNDSSPDDTINQIRNLFEEIRKYNFSSLEKGENDPSSYLHGFERAKNFLALSRKLKQDYLFSMLFINEDLTAVLSSLSEDIKNFCLDESSLADKKLGLFSPSQGIEIIKILEQIKDAQWTLEKEILENIEKIKVLSKNTANPASVSFYRKINTVLNSINILEVRGRDSAGISVFITFDSNKYDLF